MLINTFLCVYYILSFHLVSPLFSILSVYKPSHAVAQATGGALGFSTIRKSPRDEDFSGFCFVVYAQVAETYAAWTCNTFVEFKTG